MYYTLKLSSELVSTSVNSFHTHQTLLTAPFLSSCDFITHNLQNSLMNSNLSIYVVLGNYQSFTKCGGTISCGPFTTHSESSLDFSSSTFLAVHIPLVTSKLVTWVYSLIGWWDHCVIHTWQTDTTSLAQCLPLFLDSSLMTELDTGSQTRLFNTLVFITHWYSWHFSNHNDHNKGSGYHDTCASMRQRISCRLALPNACMSQVWQAHRFLKDRRQASGSLHLFLLSHCF